MIRHRNCLGFLALVLVMLMWSGCGSQRKILRTENFDSFYQKFHADSVFQYSRLSFPLQGKRVDSNGEHQWTQENWTMLTVPVFEVDTSVFNVNYKHSSRAFTQKSWIKNSGFSVEFRFEVIKRRWYLVYAQEVNL